VLHCGKQENSGGNHINLDYPAMHKARGLRPLVTLYLCGLPCQTGSEGIQPLYPVIQAVRDLRPYIGIIP